MIAAAAVIFFADRSLARASDRVIADGQDSDGFWFAKRRAASGWLGDVVVAGLDIGGLVVFLTRL